MQILTAHASLQRDLRLYRNKYLKKKKRRLDESATRIIVNHLLTDVLGYQELNEIKTEYPIKGGFIDYLVERHNRKLFVVEVKSIDTPLRFRHLRQAIYYALSAGVNLIVLTNAKDVEVYRIFVSDRLIVKRLFVTDLSVEDSSATAALSYLKKMNEKKIEATRL